MLLYTSPAVAGTYQFNLTYIPEFFDWNDAGSPITLFRLETQEEGVLVDLVAASIAAVNGFMHAGALPTNVKSLCTADGHVANRNVTVTVTIAAAAAIAFYGYSDNKGTTPFVYKNAAVLANNPTDFRRFTALFIPALAAGDRVEVDFSDGHRQTLASADLNALAAMYQQVAGIIVNNVKGYITKAQVISAAALTAYVMSVYIPGQNK